VDEVKEFEPVGYYCSCWESFKNNTNGRRVLDWWHNSCMEWCYASFEEGRFADQKYLDKWRSMFEGVRELTNIGANIAPWNIQKYDLGMNEGIIKVNDKWPLIYYHFHSFKMNLTNYEYIITGDRENFYKIPENVVEMVYTPYIKLLKECIIEAKNNAEYLEYTKENPEGNIKLANPNTKVEFSSYKEAASKE
jgi:hypothetical protein